MMAQLTRQQMLRAWPVSRCFQSPVFHWRAHHRRRFCAPVASRTKGPACPTLGTEEFPLALPSRDFIQALKVASTQPDELKRSFRLLDTDASGLLDQDELRAVFFDVTHSDDEAGRAVELMLSRYDLDQDGKLSYDEFAAAVHQLSSHVDKRAYALAATIGVAFAGFSLTFPIGPVLIQNFGLTQLQFGTLTTAFSLAKLCGNIPSSVLADVYGRKPLLVGGLLCVGIGTGGLFLATCHEHLVLLRLCVGLGVSSTFTAAGMYVTDISHPLNSARTRAPMQMGVSCGVLVGPAMGGYLLEHVGMIGTSIGVGVITTTMAAVTWFFLPETRRSGVRGGVRETLRSWRPMLADSQFSKVLGWGWCYNAAFWGAMSLLPLVYVDLGLSPMVVGSISTANALASLACMPVIAKAADRYGKMTLVIPGAIVYGSGLLFLPYATSLSELLPVLGVMQVGAAMCAQAQMHAMDRAAPADRAKVPGLWNTVGDTGMLVSSLASAVLAQATTTGTAFCADGLLILLATGVFVFNRR